MRHSLILRISAFAMLVLAIAAVPACSRRDEQASKAAPAPPAVPVSATRAVQADVPIAVRAIGNVESRARVVMRSQIDGRLIELPAQEGRDVQKGDVLARLDARMYEAALRQAEADLTRNRALAKDAHHLAERTASALATAAISKRESEEAAAKAAAADAEVLVSDAKVESARLNLEYCTITAPFAGRTGQFLIKPGAIVKENETDIVELAQTDPVDVSFAVPEENIPAIRSGIEKGVLRVEAVASGEAGAPAVGELTFVDNKVDASTGTIRLKATFGNTDRRLWPGQFVTASLIVGRDTDAVMIPESAVQTTQAGASVFVVKPDQTVELRTVTVRRIVGDTSIIENGISVGDTVVTDGQLRLASGVKVQIKAPAAAVADK